MSHPSDNPGLSTVTPEVPGTSSVSQIEAENSGDESVFDGDGTDSDD